MQVTLVLGTATMIGEIIVVGGLTEAQSLGNGIVSLIIAVIIVVHTAMAGEKSRKINHLIQVKVMITVTSRKQINGMTNTDLQNTNTTSSLIKKKKKQG